MANLDLAVVDLLEGRCKEAETRLKEVRDRFDHLEQESISVNTLSMCTDDTVAIDAGQYSRKTLNRTHFGLASPTHKCQQSDS